MGLKEIFEGNREVAEKFAKAAGVAKQQGNITCVVNGASYNVSDIKDALLRSGNGELVRKYWL